MTMRVTKWVLGLAGATLIAWGTYRAMAVYGLYRAVTDCSNEILNEASSSDGKLTATARRFASRELIHPRQTRDG